MVADAWTEVKGISSRTERTRRPQEQVLPCGTVCVTGEDNMELGGGGAGHG